MKNINKFEFNPQGIEKEIDQSECDFLIFDPPIHTDSKLQYSLLDDNSKGQEIPKGAHSVASFMEDNKIATKVVITDSFLKQEDDKDYNQRLEELIVEKIKEFGNPANIGISLMYAFTEPSVLEMVKFIKNKFPDKRVIVGGNHATFSVNRLLDPDNNSGIDFIVRGEGEETSAELMQELKRNKENPDLSSIKGISYIDKETGTVKNNPERERMQSDQLPPIDYSLLDMSSEDKLINFNHYVLFNRGCKGNCAFCTSPKMWKHEITNIAVENFEKEIMHLLKNGVRNIALLDDDILVEETAFNQITDILIKIQENKKALGLDPESEISFIVQSKVNHFVDRDKSKDILEKMIKAGIDKIYLGIESGSQAILNSMHKGLKVENTPKALENIREFAKDKIKIGAFWIIGHPGATKDEEEKSLEFLKKLIQKDLIDELEAHVFVPFPGTQAATDKKIKIDNNVGKNDYGFMNNDPAFDLINPKNGKIVMTREEIKNFLDRTLEFWNQYKLK